MTVRISKARSLKDPECPWVLPAETSPGFQGESLRKTHISGRVIGRVTILKLPQTFSIKKPVLQGNNNLPESYLSQ